MGAYEEEGRAVNFLKAGIAATDRLVTVSPGYAGGLCSACTVCMTALCFVSLRMHWGTQGRHDSKVLVLPAHVQRSTAITPPVVQRGYLM